MADGVFAVRLFASEVSRWMDGVCVCVSLRMVADGGCAVWLFAISGGQMDGVCVNLCWVRSAIRTHGMLCVCVCAVCADLRLLDCLQSWVFGSVLDTRLWKLAKKQEPPFAGAVVSEEALTATVQSRVLMVLPMDDESECAELSWQIVVMAVITALFR